MAANLTKLTPKLAATRLSVGATTVRRYCDQFSRHLSPGAVPPKGTRRELNGRDIVVLAAILEQAKAGLTYPEIDAWLDEHAAEFPDVIDIQQPIERHQTAPVAPQPPALPPTVVESMERLTTLPETLERLNATLERMQTPRPITLPKYFEVGFLILIIAMVVIAIVAVGLAIGVVG
jgi:hypothetical protein